MQIGKVIRWFPARGFGFIQPDGSDINVFLHVTQIPGEQEPYEGQAVRFELGENRRTGKRQAVNVSLGS